MKAVVGNPEALYLVLLSCILTLLPVVVPIGGGLLTALAPFSADRARCEVSMALCSEFARRGGRAHVAWRPAAATLLSGTIWPSSVGDRPGAVRRGWSISRTMVGSLVIPLGVGALLLAMYGTLVQSHTLELVTRYFDNIVTVSQEYVRSG